MPNAESICLLLFLKSERIAILTHKKNLHGRTPPYRHQPTQFRNYENGGK